MHLRFSSSCAPVVRFVIALAAVIAFFPAMALAPSAHALQTLPVTPPVPGPFVNAGRALASASVVRAVTEAEARARAAKLAERCDHESTRTGGSPACREAAFLYLRDKGLTRHQAAGVVGNLWLESSGVSPKSKQFGGGPGRGVAQWTVNQRWRGVVALARKRNVSPESLHVQLDYLWHELNTSYETAFEALKAARTVDEATLAFQNKFEVPVGTWIGGPAYAFNTHPSAHTADRVDYAGDVLRGRLR